MVKYASTTKNKKKKAIKSRTEPVYSLPVGASLSSEKSCEDHQRGRGREGGSGGGVKERRDRAAEAVSRVLHEAR